MIRAKVVAGVASNWRDSANHALREAETMLTPTRLPSTVMFGGQQSEDSVAGLVSV